MSSMRVSALSLAFIISILIAYFLQGLFQRQLTVLGVFRAVRQTPLNSEQLFIIQDTTHCEDIHYYVPSHTIFTACEDSSDTRFAWFPPLETFDDPVTALRAKGSIHVIDPEKKSSRRLDLIGFDGPFITHGIDVIPAPESEGRDAVYIFAVNHVPDLQYSELWKQSNGSSKIDWKHPRTDPRIEVFHHVLGTQSAKHIRSTRHPLVKNPNDIVALSPTSFLVTNDHHYSHGLMRSIEDAYPGAKWSNIIHVQCPEASAASLDSDNGCDATVALSELHNNNGLGHGKSSEELLIGSATSGQLHVAKIPRGFGEAIEVLETISFDSVIDNPSYFSDPYANASYDASGYVAAGLSRAIDLPKTSRDPLGREAIMAWHAKLHTNDRDLPGAPSAKVWEKRLIFEDDGYRIRSASAAVLVAIDPEVEQGQRKAWLFVSGFLSENVIAVLVDL